MSMRGLIGIAALLLLAACGTETAGPRADDPSSVAKPTEIPVPSGPVRTVYAVTVLDDGDGPELCMAGTADSLPPQCGGLPLIDWDWATLEGEYDERSGTRWGEFGVTGTFDGTALQVTETVPADEFDEPQYDDPYVFTTPCPEPEGGWRVLDPATTTEDAENATMRAARKLPDYAGSWADHSISPAFDDPPSDEWERAMSDPTQQILNVQVTGDPAAAEATLRKLWGGPLCVTQAEHTQQELLDIEEQFRDLPGNLGTMTPGNRVDAYVVFDDGSIQAWADQEFGADVVTVTPALVPVE